MDINDQYITYIIFYYISVWKGKFCTGKLYYYILMNLNQAGQLRTLDEKIYFISGWSVKLRSRRSKFNSVAGMFLRWPLGELIAQCGIKRVSRVSNTNSIRLIQAFID